MRTQRRRPWKILVGLFILGAASCQMLAHADRSLIPDGGGGQGGQADGAGGGSDAGNQ